MANPTQIVLENVRLSYVHVFKAFSNDPTQTPKFSTTILIPKDNAKNKASLDAAIAAATAAGKMGKWNGVVPPIVPTPVHDGDGVKQDGTPFGAECKGCWVMTASSPADRPIEVVDRNMQRIIDATQVYSGCYANVCVNFYAYAYQGKKGIGVGLGPIQKVADGEALGGTTPSADSCFSALGEAPGAGFSSFGQPVPAGQINPLTGMPM